eukprot:TRINITY_DN1631_c0_g1_i1.p2 TRINITY_DN1631_c0_g1~~TRINITY_DN1631_c0_g1_i1.p2  ORF type:complete len:50 (+),score=5.22 TRINITY_DN1631_c0_g1_i1:469-618(+)
MKETPAYEKLFWCIANFGWLNIATGIFNYFKDILATKLIYYVISTLFVS